MRRRSHISHHVGNLLHSGIIFFSPNTHTSCAKVHLVCMSLCIKVVRSRCFGSVHDVQEESQATSGLRSNPELRGQTKRVRRPIPFPRESNHVVRVSERTILGNLLVLGSPRTINTSQPFWRGLPYPRVYKHMCLYLKMCLMFRIKHMSFKIKQSLFLQAVCEV